MAVMEQYITTLTDFSGATNLNSMPEGHARPFGSVDFSSNEYPNCKIVLGLDFSGVSPIDGGSFVLYLASSLDNTYWSGNMNLSATTDVGSMIRNHCKEIVTIEIDNTLSDTSLVYVINDLAREVGDLPEYWGIIGLNGSGVTLPSDGHLLKYQSYSYET